MSYTSRSNLRKQSQAARFMRVQKWHLKYPDGKEVTQPGLNGTHILKCLTWNKLTLKKNGG